VQTTDIRCLCIIQESGFAVAHYPPISYITIELRRVSLTLQWTWDSICTAGLRRLHDDV